MSVLSWDGEEAPRGGDWLGDSTDTAAVGAEDGFE